MNCSESERYINVRGLCCEALIDQNRHIGEDPIGHGCCNKATRKWEDEKMSIYLCESCYSMLGLEPERLTLVPRPKNYEILVDTGIGQ